MLLQKTDFFTTTDPYSALYPSEVAKSSTSFGWGKAEKVTAAQKLCVIPYGM